MIARLVHPYPFEKSAQHRVIASVLFGLFVAGFLYGFKPFGMSNLSSEAAFVALIFGLICTVSMLFLSFIIVELFPAFFNERSWTVARELAWTLFHILFIGLINALFAASVGMGSFTPKFILLFEWYTLLIGVFPVTVSILLREMRLNAKYRRESQQLSGKLPGNKTEAEQETIVLESDNRNEDLSVRPGDILYLEAADNYVEVVFHENGALKKHLLRATLKSLEEALAENPAFLRVHKSYLVNNHHIDRVSGNAQGYRLHFEGIAEPVPVSRRQNNLLRERLAVNFG